MSPNPQNQPASIQPLGIEITTSRVFDSPRDKVFAAFANPEYLARWWGPSGFTNTIDVFDFRPGGSWRLVMHGPDGKNYENASEFVEVVTPERIVFQHLLPMHEFRMTMTYADAPSGGTRLTWRMVLARSSENEKLKDFLAGANEQNFDRLALCLAQMK